MFLISHLVSTVRKETVKHEVGVEHWPLAFDILKVGEFRWFVVVAIGILNTTNISRNACERKTFEVNGL